jgi:hypothetical protein
MDERLERALAFANYRATVENRHKSIRRRFETMQLHYKNNGMFKANQETISFVDTLIRLGHKTAVILDEKLNPILIDDLPGFLSELTDTYFVATNELLVEMQKIAKARDVKKVLDW